MAFETPADYYRFFANESRKGGSPLYELLSLRIADSEHIQRLAAGKRPGQPAANLIFGAVQYLLLSGVQHELGAYYPAVGGTQQADARAWDLFVDFCDRYEKDIVKIVNERVTNTNEVGRSALLAPAFEIVAKEAGAPLGLIEIGPSAGLNLNFDKYGYQYTDEAGRPRLERGLNAGFILKCTLKGPGVPVLERFPPAVGSRIGLELSPIDITLESERRWLKALIWPERMDRMARLEGALRVARVTPPSIVGGDAVLNLATAVTSIPKSEARVVYHTVMSYQLSGKQMQTIEETLRRASKDRPVWRVTVEGEISGPNPKETFTPLKIHRYMDGEHTVRSYGICDPHGLWFEWKG